MFSGSDPKYKTASQEIKKVVHGIDITKVPTMKIYLSLGYKTPKIYNLKYQTYSEEFKKYYPTCNPPDVSKQIEKISGKFMCLGIFGVSHKTNPCLSKANADQINAIKNPKVDFIAMAKKMEKAKLINEYIDSTVPFRTGMIFEIPKEELSFTLDDAVDPDEVKDGEL
jgi:hypothetical protein